MKRALFLMIFLCAFFAFLFPGKTLGIRQQLYLTRLVNLIEADGGTADGFELDGWAVLKEQKPENVLNRINFDRFATGPDKKFAVLTSQEGSRRRFCRNYHYKDGTEVQVIIQKNEHETSPDLCYVLLKCKASGVDQTKREWERRFGDALRSLGGEHGLYITVKGTLPGKMTPFEQLDWGKSLYREGRGRITGIQRTESYLSLTGYSPMFGEEVLTGRFKTNLNLALTGSPESNNTHIFLGTPLITAEY